MGNFAHCMYRVCIIDASADYDVRMREDICCNAIVCHAYKLTGTVTAL